MRLAGLDEHYIAEKYANVADKLDRTDRRSDHVEKLQVDVLKEFTRLLNTPKSSVERAAERAIDRHAGRQSQIYAPVILIHRVDRPDRRPLRPELTDAKAPELPEQEALERTLPAQTLSAQIGRETPEDDPAPE